MVNEMKKLFLVLAASLGIAACASYEGRSDYPYHHYSCAYHCDTVGGCRTTCGNHYYSENGIVYYYDADHHRWDGAARYRQEQPKHHEPDEKNAHDRSRF